MGQIVGPVSVVEVHGVDVYPVGGGDGSQIGDAGRYLYGAGRAVINAVGRGDHPPGG